MLVYHSCCITQVYQQDSLSCISEYVGLSQLLYHVQVYQQGSLSCISESVWSSCIRKVLYSPK